MRKLLFLIILTSNFAFSQDTIRVYFDFGSSKVKKQYHPELDNIPYDYNLSEVDSIQLIGYADSVGNWNSNVRLSMKRASHIQKYCTETFGSKPVSIHARGEGTQADASLNRRVELIFHYPKERAVQPELISDKDPRCFFIDVEALDFCHVKAFTERKKEMVHIEAMNIQVFKDHQHYYIQKDAHGKVTIRKVKWKLENTGKLWWRKKRLTTDIPKASYDQFKIFTLENPPCTGCSEDILATDTNVLTTGYSTDYFLMDNLQVKVRLFGKDRAKLRVPREYVDIDQEYHLNNERLKWETKPAKRKQAYYFVEVALEGGYIPPIRRESVLSTCPTVGIPYTPSPPRGCCLGCGSGGSQGFMLLLEPGVFRHNDTTTAFLTGGLAYVYRKSFVSLQGGINTHLGFYGSLNYRYHFLLLDFRSFNPRKKWQSPQDLMIIRTYGRLYAGSEVRTSYLKNGYRSFLEGNVHLGFSFTNINERSLFSNIYLHGGYANDFSHRINADPYPFVQLGIVLNLNSIFIRNSNRYFLGSPMY